MSLQKGTLPPEICHNETTEGENNNSLIHITESLGPQDFGHNKPRTRHSQFFLSPQKIDFFG